MVTPLFLMSLAWSIKASLGLVQKGRAFTDHLVELKFGAKPEDPRPAKDRRHMVSLYMTPEEVGALNAHRVFLRGRNGAEFLQEMGSAHRCETCDGLSLR
jgi:hypothetical protein